MTAKATIEQRTRVCPVCAGEFIVPKPSTKQRCCSHSCAFSEIAETVRKSASTPEAIRKMADKLRGRGSGKSYIKRDGRHEHRTIAEKKIGRPLVKGEIVHHRDHQKHNNAPDNLEVLGSQGEHATLHHLGAKRNPKSHCKFGHLFTDDNTLITSAGRRRCLTCARAYDREWKKKARHNKEETQNAHR